MGNHRAEEEGRPEGGQVTLYRYGLLGGLWRLLAVFGFLGGGLMLWFTSMTGSLWYVVASAALAGPSLFFPLVLADRIELDGDTLVVRNLFYVTRRIGRDEFEQPRIKRSAQSLGQMVPAPRAWLRVRGRLPVYLDLWADIPDPQRFKKALKLGRLPRGVGPNR